MSGLYRDAFQGRVRRPDFSYQYIYPCDQVYFKGRAIYLNCLI